MRMRAVVMALAVLAAGTVQALAAENFIVRGHPYAPGDDQLPPLNSEQDDVDLQTDILESEIYVTQRHRKVLDSDMSRFINNQELTGPDHSVIDY